MILTLWADKVFSNNSLNNGGMATLFLSKLNCVSWNFLFRFRISPIWESRSDAEISIVLIPLETFSKTFPIRSRFSEMKPTPVFFFAHVEQTTPDEKNKLINIPLTQNLTKVAFFR